MKSYIKKTHLVLFAGFIFFGAKGQVDVCDTSSCMVGKAGKYKVELERKCSDKLTIYVHSPKDLTLKTKEILGYVDYFYSDANYFVEELYRYPGANKLEAPIPCTGYFNLKVTLVIDKETISVFFDNECTLRALFNFDTPRQ